MSEGRLFAVCSVSTVSINYPAQSLKDFNQKRSCKIWIIGSLDRPVCIDSRGYIPFVVTWNWLAVVPVTIIYHQSLSASLSRWWYRGDVFLPNPSDLMHIAVTLQCLLSAWRCSASGRWVVCTQFLEAESAPVLPVASSFTRHWASVWSLPCTSYPGTWHSSCGGMGQASWWGAAGGGSGCPECMCM